MRRIGSRGTGLIVYDNRFVSTEYEGWFFDLCENAIMQ